MAKVQITGFKPNAVPSKSGVHIAAEKIDRFSPSPVMVESKSDLRTKRSGSGSTGKKY
jgi:hypothetical protein